MQRPSLGGSAALAGWILNVPLARSAPAANCSVPFGPEEYTRSTAGPNVTTESFAPRRPDRPFTLRAENGSRELTRVSSISFVLTAAEVVTAQNARARFAPRVQVVAMTYHLGPGSEAAE